MFSKLLKWVKVTAAGTDDKQFHTQQVSHLGKVSNGIMLTPYGLHYNAQPDSLGLAMDVQCNPENRAVLAWAAKVRPTLAAGEVAFYHPDTLSYVIWREGGNLEIVATGNVTATVSGTMSASVTGGTTITTPTLTLNGDLVVNGTMTNNGFDVGNTHQHSQGPDSNGDSEANIVGVL